MTGLRSISWINATALQKRGAILQDMLADDQASVDRGFALIMNEQAGLLNLGVEYHNLLRIQVAQVEQEDCLSPETVEEWRVHVLDMGQEAEDLRKLLTFLRENAALLKELHDHKTQIILGLFSILDKQIEELIYLVEDIAETMALALHEPFRDALKQRLLAAGVT